MGVSNTNPLYDTTGWQLEKGETATAYEHLSYSEELGLAKVLSKYFTIWWDITVMTSKGQLQCS